MRIIIGNIVQESNSFSPVPGSWAHFPPGLLLRGEEMLARRIGTRTEIGGAIDAARELGAALLPTISATTSASAGPMLDEVYIALRDELAAALRAAGPADGALLVLHGAMSSESHEDATGDILRAARAALGQGFPLVATLDLHANLTTTMVEHADAVVGYHTAPHIDLYETGERAMRLLARMIRSEARPIAALRRLPMIVPAENGRTTEGPYAEVMDRAIALMRRPGVLDISVFSVQPWLDVEDVGCSVVAYANGNQALADELADELAEMLWARRRDFAVSLTPTATTIARALAAARGPFVLADSADAPSSGAPGDSTAVLEQLIAAQPTRPCLHNIVDPQAVALMFEAGLGAEVSLQIGAGSGVPLYRPIMVTGLVIRLADGDFTNRGQGFQGVVFCMGRTAVLEIGAITLVVMERAVIQWDPELYRSVGLEPSEAQIVIVKSPAAFRAAYEPFAAEVAILDAPGVCSPNLRSLPFQHARRPIFPLDDLTTWP
jgi:microcystin degradation protein MlrC